MLAGRPRPKLILEQLCWECPSLPCMHAVCVCTLALPILLLYPFTEIRLLLVTVAHAYVDA